MKKEEEIIHARVCNYLRLKYPLVFFFSDPSGIKMSIGMAVKLKATRSLHKQIDLFIAHPVGKYSGMFIEIKKDLNEVLTKKGEMRNSEHIKAQYKSLRHLSNEGYYAVFGCGYDDCIEEIEKYFQGNVQ